MKLEFLNLPDAERQLYFEQAAIRRNLSSVIMEKDFWVCWLLKILFQSSFAEHLVFKGGTSLSKVYRVLDRFSEDIDLSISPGFLNLPSAGTSRNQASKWMKKAEAACSDAVQNEILPAIEMEVTNLLGSRVSAWLEFLIDDHTNSPVIFFRYPTSQVVGFEYLKRTVKLEFGSLTDQQPTEKHDITPWLAEVFPDAFRDWKCEVTALDIGRSF